MEQSREIMSDSFFVIDFSWVRGLDGYLLVVFREEARTNARSWTVIATNGMFDNTNERVKDYKYPHTTTDSQLFKS